MSDRYCTLLPIPGSSILHVGHSRFTTSAEFEKKRKNICEFEISGVQNVENRNNKK
jgi:hypothetical protein